MKKLRVSFTLLDLFSKGQIDEAVAMYLKVSTKTSLALQEGKEYHKKWQEEIEKNKEMKIGNSHFKFKKPLCEQKLVVNYNKHWDLVGVIDCLDLPTLYEFKTGVSTSVDYSRSYQVPFYSLLTKLYGHYISDAYIIHYNQKTKNADFIKMWITEEIVAKGKNFIDTIAPEVYEYFTDKKII